jgi:two-component system cell cycle sensor histidine kinase/response regulator CckA
MSLSLPPTKWSPTWACVLAVLPGLALAQVPPDAPSATGRADFATTITERQPLVVGVGSNSYPFGFLDQNGQPTGFANDLLDAVARVMNLKIKRVTLPGGELYNRFRGGEFDVLQIFSQTPDRETYAEFSVPFLSLQAAIFVQKEGGPPIRKLEDFNGRRFAIIGVGTIGEKFIRDHNLHVEQVTVASSDLGLQLVDKGACAGVLVSRLTALSVIEHWKIRNVTQLDLPLGEYDIRHCFAVHKGDAVLLARLNEGLAILHRTGEFDQIFRKWFGGIVGPVLTREQVVMYGAIFLAVAFLAALGALLHQRALHRRIARQADELASQKALLQALYDNVPLSMCVFEEESGGYRLLTLNRQAEPLFGLARGEATGRLVRELSINPDFSGHLSALLNKAGTTRRLVREERTLPAAGRRLVVTLVPLEAGPDGRMRVCLLAEDVTERHNLDEEIAQTRKLRAVGELVGGIAHEFNNLLTPILLKAGEITLDWPHDPRLHREMLIITGAVQRAADLTRRLLTFGRKNEGGAEEVHLDAVVDNCFALLRLTMDRRIEWINDVPPGLPPLHFNTNDLNQILVNLILNARDTLVEKLSREHEDWAPKIWVEARALPPDSRPPLPDQAPWAALRGWQRLTVRDNGIGMSPEVRERIFEPFFTTKEVGHGTGLGLATVWHLVNVAGGRVEVESTPGMGTAFHIYLPVGTAGPPERAPEASVRPAVFTSARVFLAEDEDLVAKAVASALERAGHTVQRESDGAAAWRRLQDKPGEFDLLVLDMNMPGMTGIELVQRLRTSGAYHGPIMIISGRLDSDEMQRLTAAEVACVLTKPFAIAEFQEAVQRCLAVRTE